MSHHGSVCKRLNSLCDVTVVIPTDPFRSCSLCCRTSSTRASKSIAVGVRSEDIGMITAIATFISLYLYHIIEN